jgi:hypothetical protein
MVSYSGAWISNLSLKQEGSTPTPCEIPKMTEKMAREYN